MHKASSHAAGFALLAAYSAASSFFLMLTDPSDAGYVVLGFLLALLFSLHPVMKAYIRYLREQEQARLRALAEQARQDRLARRREAEEAQARQVREARLLALAKQEHAEKMAVARRADHELLRRAGE